MASLPYLPLYPKDIITDDRMNELKSEDRGLFLLFLCWLWIKEDEVKNNDSRISRNLNISEEKWKELKEQLIDSGLLRLDADGCLRNNRLTQEKLKSFDKSQRAQKGALARWGKENATKYQRGKGGSNEDVPRYYDKPIMPKYDDDDGMCLD